MTTPPFDRCDRSAHRCIDRYTHSVLCLAYDRSKAIDAEPVRRCRRRRRARRRWSELVTAHAAHLAGQRVIDRHQQRRH